MKTTKPKEQDRAKDQAKAQLQSILEMVSELDAADDEARDGKDDARDNVRAKAEQGIRESPLSVEVRSDWHEPGATPDIYGEYNILLCTGGPACRIIGELDQYNQPKTARIEYQDWGTPWTEYWIDKDTEDQVLQYCRQFYFGD